MESSRRPPGADLFLRDINRFPARNHFCSRTPFLPLGKAILREAVSLKGAWFVVRIYCQGERKFLLPRECQAGDSAKWSVTGPSFSATVTALCKGGRKPGQRLGTLPAAQPCWAPSVWGISDQGQEKKENFPHVILAIF